MNPEIFAEWFRRQGHSVIRTESSYWTNSGPHVYQAFPYHWLIEPSEVELTEFLTSHKAIGLRYSTPLSANFGRLSYHVCYEDNGYEIGALAKKARYDVRKGLEYATYEPISLTRLAAEGWSIRKDTLIRQGRKNAETQKWWNKLCSSADGLPGFEAWGALHEGQLIAALLAFTCENCFSILYQQSLADQLKYGINNALTYMVTKNVMERSEIDKIFYGLHSLDAPENVDKFKFRMNYSAKAVRQRVVIHPILSPIFNRATHTVVKKLMDWSNNSMLAKMEGLIRFYCEGQQPLEQQTDLQALIDHQLQT